MFQKHPLGPVFLAYLTGVLLHRVGGDLVGPYLGLVGTILVGRWLLSRFPWNLLLSYFLILASGYFQTGIHSRPAKEFLSPCKSNPTLWRGKLLSAPIQLDPGAKWRARIKLLSCRSGNHWLPIESGRTRPTPWVEVSDSSLARGDSVQGVLEIESYSGRQHFWENKLPGFKRYKVKSNFGMIRYRNGLFSSLGLGKLQAQLSAALRKSLEPTLAGVLLAIVVGEKRYLSPEVRKKWADAGVAHLLAISGLHLGLLCVFVWWTTMTLVVFIPRFPEYFCVRTLSCVTTLGALIFFCWWVGSPVSAVRATVMCSFALVGNLWGGNALSWNGLFLAALLILMARPLALEECGFWLSFVSSGALLLFMNSDGINRGMKLKRWLYESINISVITGLCTAPILALIFGRVSLLSPISNLLAVPIASFLFTPFAFLYCLWTYLEWPGKGVCRWFLEKSYLLLDTWLTAISHFPFAAVEISERGAYFLTATLAFLVMGRFGSKKRIRGVSLIVGLFFAVVALRAEKSSATIDALQFQSGEWGMVFPYVGQGDGAILRLPSGEVMVIDAGGSWGHGRFDPGRDVMGPLLESMGITRINIAVLTHSHPDHIQGFLHLTKHFPINQLWFHGDDAHPLVKAIIYNVKNNGGVVKSVKELPGEISYGGLDIQPLHPRPGGSGEKTYDELNENENSVVLRFDFKGRSALFTGDIEAMTEYEWGIHWPHSEIIKVPHHGSRTSSTREFLRAINPEVGILSSGEGNRFGLPHPLVIQRYQDEGIKLLRTDCAGTIVARTFGKTWTFETADPEEDCGAFKLSARPQG